MSAAPIFVCEVHETHDLKHKFKEIKNKAPLEKTKALWPNAQCFMNKFRLSDSLSGSWGFLGHAARYDKILGFVLTRPSAMTTS